MRVIFRRTGARRYAVLIQSPGRAAQTMDPAPGFDLHIPHDLVHYVVEAELGLDAGVFGSAARGGGTFYAADAASSTAESARERARLRRKQARRERALRREHASEAQLETSERFAYLSDIAWRRRHGARPDPARWQAATPIPAADVERVERVVARLDQLAQAWSQLPIGGELAFEWPSVIPRASAAP